MAFWVYILIISLAAGGSPYSVPANVTVSELHTARLIIQETSGCDWPAALAVVHVRMRNPSGFWETGHLQSYSKSDWYRALWLARYGMLLPDPTRGAVFLLGDGVDARLLAGRSVEQTLKVSCPFGHETSFR